MKGRIALIAAAVSLLLTGCSLFDGSYGTKACCSMRTVLSKNVGRVFANRKSS